MKRLISIGIATMLACSLVACGEKEKVYTEPKHEQHQCTKIRAKDPTCLKEGNIEYWSCFGCDKIYKDAEMSEELSLDDVALPKLSHDIVGVGATDSTCTEQGNIAHWYCKTCFTFFEDEKGTVIIENRGDVQLHTAAHTLSHYEAVAPSGRQNGNVEYWQCEECYQYFLDSQGWLAVSQDSTVSLAAYNIPDFVVDVPVNKDPVVLQLTDTQIIDAAQARPGRGGVDHEFWATDKMDERCYDYITEIVEATDPDLIILTGDVIYGEFDDNGTALTRFINFMETLQTPWAPIFGNHDNESKMGADWQCQQFENAQYCLFEQKTLTGNGNYSVGIAQGDEIKRVFYMLDSNGCGAASVESLANGHTKTTEGFGQDQIDWYTQEITALKAVSPNTKISFAYHIQTAIFEKAFAQYGFAQPETIDNTKNSININIDRLVDKAATDFGYIGRPLKNPWDTNYMVYEGMKALGADSMFVGHEHCNSASVVYDGIRFQYGQKTSEYDRYNYLYADGTIDFVSGKGSKSLMGGTVISLSKVDGGIQNPYIYYCGYSNGQIDWSQWLISK